VTESEVQFPAVTVCNQNPWRRSSEKCYPQTPGCAIRQLDQLVRFDALMDPWFRSQIHAELNRQHYDLRRTFPTTHPTEWIARLFTSSNKSDLHFNTSNSARGALNDFLFDFDDEFTNEELRGLWSIFTNETENAEFIKLINVTFTNMPSNWSNPGHENYTIYKHAHAVYSYVHTHHHSNEFRFHGPLKYFDLLPIGWLGSDRGQIVKVVCLKLVSGCPRLAPVGHCRLTPGGTRTCMILCSIVSLTERIVRQQPACRLCLSRIKSMV
jgi:hypothetical protein